MPKPDDHVVLPDIISKEPLGPSVRQGDGQWFTIVKWVHYALLNAEEAGVTQANVDEMLSSDQSRHQAPARQGRRLRQGPRPRQRLGRQRSSRQVGNYGEIFERNVGAGSRLKIDRGLNNLWTKGGLQYAPPIR